MMVRRLDWALLLVPTLALTVGACKGGEGDGGSDDTDTNDSDEGDEDTEDVGDESDTEGTDEGEDSGDDTPTDTDDEGSEDSGDSGSTGDDETGTDDSGTGEDSGSGDSGDTGTDDDEVVNGLIAALCDWEFRCCSGGEVDYRLGTFTTDAQDCTDRFVDALQSNDLNNPYPRADLLAVLGYGIDLSRSSPISQGIMDCIAALDARACNAVAGDPVHCEEASDPIDVCRLDHLFVGTLSVGDPCNSDLSHDVECAPGSTCEFVTAQSAYLCVEKGLVDDFCADNGECDEDQNLYCDGSTGRCAEKGALGDACEFLDVDNPTPGTESKPCQEPYSCNPDSEECTEYCSLGFTCVSDYQCPDGLSCAPAEAGAAYGYCRAPGTTSAALCDTHLDCATNRHCWNDHCEPDIPRGDACTEDYQCSTDDDWCNVNCTIYTAVDATCTVDNECNPGTAPAGCLGPVGTKACKAALLANNDECEDDTECASGLCEDIGGGMAVCHAGAALDAACDTNTADDTRLRCALGLYCDDPAAGNCRTQVGPGISCAMDDDLQCLSNDCSDHWSTDMCSDAAVSADTATCDGEA